MITDEQKDAALAYLRNINTRPGANAGRSIDPTKPGPDADRIALLERARSVICEFYPIGMRTTNADAKLQEIDAELSRLRNEQPKGGDAALKETNLPHNPMPRGPGDSAKSPGPQDVRALLREARQYVADAGGDEELTTSELQLHKIGLLEDIDAALAQSDAQPVGWIYKPIRETKWQFTTDAEKARLGKTEFGWPVEPVFTAPPRPDTSGLMDAAEPWSPKETAQAIAGSARDWSESVRARNIETFIHECVRRAPAADRSAT